MTWRTPTETDIINAGNSGAGGNGALYGAGGGGGAAGTNDVGNSGAGGNGAGVYALITDYYHNVTPPPSPSCRAPGRSYWHPHRVRCVRHAKAKTTRPVRRYV